ncbi:MAG: hypothetical protein ACOX7F_06820 [Eubacteriales bacterium]|jgi:hypothetical protein
MPMKYPCDMIRDLIPQVQQGRASSFTQHLVQDHLSQCPQCQQKYPGGVRVQPWRRWLKWLYAAVVACLLLLLFYLFQGNLLDRWQAEREMNLFLGANYGDLVQHAGFTGYDFVRDRYYKKAQWADGSRLILYYEEGAISMESDQ